MELSKYPRPVFDTGLGIHGGANAFFPLGENGPNWAIQELKEMGFSWVKLLDVEGSSLECVQACAVAGIEPIVRLYRGQPQPGTLDDAPKTKAAVPSLIAAGAHYFEVSNEDNIIGEQKSGTIPADAPEKSAMGFMVDADYIISCGGIPMITAMSPGGNRDDIEYLQKMVWYLKEHWGVDKLAKCAVAVHNAALNHPLAYPNEPVNQAGMPVSTEEFYSNEWATGNIAELNEWRRLDKNPNQSINDPGASNSWRKYEAVHNLVLKETGLVLPILSTEGGVWPGDINDRRYCRNTMQHVTDSYLQIAKDMMGGVYPDYYFCTCYWLIANKGMGNPAMEYEYQAWFPWDGAIPVVQAYKDMPKQVRPWPNDTPPGPPCPGPSYDDLFNVSWGAMGISWNPDAYFFKYAALNGLLGIPMTNEFDFTADCAFYRGQIFHKVDTWIVYAPIGQWDKTTHVRVG